MKHTWPIPDLKVHFAIVYFFLLLTQPYNRVSLLYIRILPRHQLSLFTATPSNSWCSVPLNLKSLHETVNTDLPASIVLYSSPTNTLYVTLPSATCFTPLIHGIPLVPKIPITSTSVWILYSSLLHLRPNSTPSYIVPVFYTSLKFQKF